jgi:hypothetical protein
LPSVEKAHVDARKAEKEAAKAAAKAEEKANRPPARANINHLLRAQKHVENDPSISLPGSIAHLSISTSNTASTLIGGLNRHSSIARGSKTSNTDSTLNGSLNRHLSITHGPKGPRVVTTIAGDLDTHETEQEKEENKYLENRKRVIAAAKDEKEKEYQDCIIAAAMNANKANGGNPRILTDAEKRFQQDAEAHRVKGDVHFTPTAEEQRRGRTNTLISEPGTAKRETRLPSPKARRFRILPGLLRKRSTKNTKITKDTKDTKTPSTVNLPASKSKEELKKSKSSTSLKSKAKPSPALPPNQEFRLTPLSGLIKQSFRDIETLKNVHGQIVESTSANPSPNLNTDAGATQVQPINFTKIEANLQKFEVLYNSFLEHGDEETGGPAEEVLMVAMVCKRSEVLKGAGLGIKKGESDEVVPKAEKGKEEWVYEGEE